MFGNETETASNATLLPNPTSDFFEVNGNFQAVLPQVCKYSFEKNKKQKKKTEKLECNCFEKLHVRSLELKKENAILNIGFGFSVVKQPPPLQNHL